MKRTRKIDEEAQALLRHKHIKEEFYERRFRFDSKSALVSLLLLCIIFFLSIFNFKHLYNQNNKLDSVVGSKGAVAVEGKECSEVGLDILKKNGSAVDAAIASALCIGVINSFATGIGGGGFMLIRTANGSYEHIDFRETAPAAAHKDMFNDNPIAAQRGGLAVAVPGEIRGFGLAHQRHGRLPWKDLFDSAIRIAEDGFEVTEHLYSKLKKSKSWIEESPGFAEVFAPTGFIAKPGEIIKRPTLAETLRTIAAKGADVFYNGYIAESLVNATQNAGGILTLDDMKNYQPIIRPVIQTTYHGRKVITTSAPTSGPALLGILNLIEPYYFNNTINDATISNLTIHRLIEAYKFGFAFRSELGDPKFTGNEKLQDQIITKEWADNIRSNITDNTTHGYLYYNPKYDNSESHGTMHLSVIDNSDQSAVALTSTVNLMFGAKFMDPITGVILNDEMDDFSIPGVPNNFGLYPSPYNFIAPGKRPLSTITPTMLEDENQNLEMVVGGSGGSQILTATLNVILNTLDFHYENVFEAVKAPRIHHQLLPNEIQFESGFKESILQGLSRRGHSLRNVRETGTISAAQAIRRFKNGTLHAASDPRKDGIAAAY
ncbi:gamma-glutamyltranspeptidase [Mycotypha africana]|uniref:gamma-glutamyltranspeptidase n=1 Tax=Mycotypha africana TaxID=64632 RepID=UPI002301A814|nr:gamma-glutamyltranspeptidase [Mycotypha africana]KAI8979758.1 gamma-glutamyltranspeptidase [Mycotypha africana]